MFLLNFRPRMVSFDMLIFLQKNGEARAGLLYVKYFIQCKTNYERV